MPPGGDTAAAAEKPARRKRHFEEGPGAGPAPAPAAPRKPTPKLPPAEVKAAVAADPALADRFRGEITAIYTSYAKLLGAKADEEPCAAAFNALVAAAQGAGPRGPWARSKHRPLELTGPRIWPIELT
jgi:hypothetical protein